MNNFLFSENDAINHGVNCAIFLNVLKKEISNNKNNSRFIFGTTVWCSATISDFSRMIPFFSIEQIRYCIKKLKNKNIIRCGNFNDSKLDRTLWYTINDSNFLIKKDGAGGGSHLMRSKEVMTTSFGEISSFDDIYSLYFLIREKKRLSYYYINLCKYINSINSLNNIKYIKLLNISNILIYKDKTKFSQIKKIPKNDKAEKKNFSPPKENPVFLTSKQHDFLCAEYGTKNTNEKISALSRYRLYVKYKNHFVTLKNWLEKDMNQKNAIKISSKCSLPKEIEKLPPKQTEEEYQEILKQREINVKRVLKDIDDFEKKIYTEYQELEKFKNAPVGVLENEYYKIKKEEKNKIIYNELKNKYDKKINELNNFNLNEKEKITQKTKIMLEFSKEYNLNKDK